MRQHALEDLSLLVVLKGDVGQHGQLGEKSSGAIGISCAPGGDRVDVVGGDGCNLRQQLITGLDLGRERGLEPLERVQSLRFERLKPRAGSPPPSRRRKAARRTGNATRRAAGWRLGGLPRLGRPIASPRAHWRYCW